MEKAACSLSSFCTFVSSCLRVSLFSVVFLVFLLSCATSPKPGPGPAEGGLDFSMFPPGGELYLWVDVVPAKALLEAISFEGLNSRDISQILERTDTAMAVFYPENTGRRFFLAGWGNYPSIGAGASMSFNRGWKRVKSETGKRYWYSGGYGLGIALGPQLAFVSDGDPLSPGGVSDPAPGGFEEFRRFCVLSGWLNDPDTLINRFISNLGVPIQIPAEDFFFGVARSPAEGSSADGETGDLPWEFVFRIRTPSANHARSLLALFSMARFFIQLGGADTGVIDAIDAEEGPFAMNPQELASLLFANVPEQDGEFLTLRTASLGADSIALLFNSFRIYSN